MTLDEATAHIGNPVLIRTSPRRTADAEIVKVDSERRMVGLRVHYQVLARGWRPGVQWWHPVHLSVPRWWLDRQAS